jgi:NADPH-dependent 2,4-dienoyl-CoA reductase/sulfur reductase-like enzyme
VKHVVILGAGFAGLELATRLSESLPGEVRTTLIDQNDSFTFGFSKLDVLFGRKTKEDVRLHYSDISKDRIEFRQERVTRIDPESTAYTSGKRVARLWSGRAPASGAHPCDELPERFHLRLQAAADRLAEREDALVDDPVVDKVALLAAGDNP